MIEQTVAKYIDVVASILREPVGGDIVGTIVGVPVGDIVGTIVGKPVGSIVGVTVGDIVGTFEQTVF